MLFTYIARQIKEFSNNERKKNELPEIYFKLASSNPRNEINRANEFESLLLKRMNAGELSKFKEVSEDNNGDKFLYFAMANDPNAKSCLLCHGDPADAPKEMVDLYPQAAGYHEEEGNIRSLISIRVPLKTHLRAGEKISNTLTMVTFIILSLILSLIWFFIKYADTQHQIILDKNQQLERTSITDYLTNIYNRMGFMQAAEQPFSGAKRYDKSFSLIMLDLDHFKQVNDTHGHETGDRVLQELALLIKSRLRTSDIFGRVGGEEFLIAVVEQSEEGAATVANVLRTAVADFHFVKDLSLTASFGVAELTDEVSLSALISHADQALYHAKNAGRNRFCLYSAEV